MRIRLTYAVLFFLSISFVNAQEFTLDTLLYNSETESRVNYIIIGDGYLESQLPDFLNDARQITTDLFDTSPFIEYRNFFNVFAISVPSNEEGAALHPNDPIDNYFGSTFNYAGIERLLVPVRTDRLNSVLATNFPTYDQAIVLVNSTKYGGSGGVFATSSVNSEASEIAIHEIGHSFAGLSDEYWAGAQFARESPNMTRETSSEFLKWKNWIGDEAVGVYPHSVDANWKKPHLNCKMQFLGGDFCAVCKERFIKTIYDLALPIESYTPLSLVSQEEMITFDLKTIDPIPNTLKITWYLNEDQVAGNQVSYELDRATLPNGSHNVQAIIYDSTSLDRQDYIFMTSVTWTIATEITSEISKELLERSIEEPGEVVTTVRSEVENSFFRIYPNPSNDVLKISYHLTGKENLKIRLLNGEGKEVGIVIRNADLSGSPYQELDISQLKDGLYVIQLTSGNFSESHRFLKQ